MSIEFRSQVNQAFSGLLGFDLGRAGAAGRDGSSSLHSGETGSDFPQRSRSGLSRNPLVDRIAVMVGGWAQTTKQSAGSTIRPSES